jgi:hypothetical protein
MLGQNHFAQSNWHISTFLHAIGYLEEFASQLDPRSLQEKPLEVQLKG